MYRRSSLEIFLKNKFHFFAGEEIDHHLSNVQMEGLWTKVTDSLETRRDTQNDLNLVEPIKSGRISKMPRNILEQKYFEKDKQLHTALSHISKMKKRIGDLKKNQSVKILKCKKVTGISNN